MADESDGFGRAVEAVHAGVFPLDAQGAGIAAVVEGADEFLEVDVAAAGGAEVPAAAGVAEGEMRAEDAGGGGKKRWRS